MSGRVIRKLIKPYKRKNLRKVPYVRKHYRIIHLQRDPQYRTLQAILSVFDDHPNLALSVSDISGQWKMHRETVLKYLLVLEKKKIIKRAVRNNRVYWIKA